MKDWKGHPDQRFGGYTYAQHGDDLMFLNIFDLIGITNPRYLDIGAHHPTRISNTALLYLRGARGINVEANPHLIEAFRKERPGDTNINVGVGPERANLPFFMYSDDHGRNTFSTQERDICLSESRQNKVLKIINIEVITLMDVVNRYCNGLFPDLLTMDIEGFDLEVLSSADFSMNQPKVICIETRRKDGETMKQFMRSRGYFCFCRIIENLIFIQNEFQMNVY